MEINYSIIIPHHNTPELLYRCLDSIPEREDIQIIVVDDNSEDDKKPQCNKSNLEIVYLTKIESKGAGRARNVGLAKAKGKWLLFADADDFYLKDAFNLCDEYLNSNFDIVYLGIDSVDSDTGKRVDRYKVYNKYIVACDNRSQELKDMLRFRHDVPWGKMIRHSIVKTNNIKFGETRYCNDTLFSTFTALSASSIYSNVSPFYCVTERSGSLVTHASLDAYFIRYEVILTKNKILRQNGYGKYQLPVANYLRKISKFGLIPTFNAIILGINYRANFLVGSENWFRSKK